MKFRSVFLTLCAALISASLVSCGSGNMNNNGAADTSTSANSSADSTNRTETSESSRETSDGTQNGEDSDIMPGGDTGNERRGMNMRMQGFDDGAEEIRQ